MEEGLIFTSFLADDNNLDEKSAQQSSLWTDIDSLESLADVRNSHATSFLESYLNFRRRPWERRSEQAGTDVFLLKKLDDVVFRHIKRCGEEGVLDSITFLDTAALFTSDSMELLETSMEKNPTLRDSVHAAIRELVSLLRAASMGGEKVTLFFVVDSLQMLRWLPESTRSLYALGESAADAMQVLGGFYDRLIPQVVREAKSDISRSELDTLTVIARGSLLDTAERVLREAENEHDFNYALEILEAGGPFSSQMRRRDLAGLAKKFANMNVKEKAKDLTQGDDKVGLDWYRGRVINEDGYLYDDDVDDEEDADPIGAVDQDGDVHSEDSDDGVNRTPANTAGAGPSSSKPSRGQGSGVGTNGTGEPHRGSVPRGGRGRGNAASSSSRGAFAGGTQKRGTSTKAGPPKSSSAPSESSSNSSSQNTQRSRAAKDRRKSSVANHNRKDRAVKKSARGGF